MLFRLATVFFGVASATKLFVPTDQDGVIHNGQMDLIDSDGYLNVQGMARDPMNEKETYHSAKEESVEELLDEKSLDAPHRVNVRIHVPEAQEVLMQYPS